LVLLVEGEDDKLAFGAILASLSPTLKQVLSHNLLAIDTLMGASHLAFKLAQMRDTLCISHAFLDNDDAGRKAFGSAKAEGLITEADATFSVCEGMVDSEAEDLYQTTLYEGMILAKYGVSLASPKFKGNKKWSQRMRETFGHQGKLWTTSEAEVKRDIAELVAKSPEIALNAHKKSSVEALVGTLEKLLTSIKPLAALS
jgi:putative ATP-dependent endonuclease of the OLD family